jgi:hypothetical protein
MVRDQRMEISMSSKSATISINKMIRPRLKQGSF